MGSFTSGLGSQLGIAKETTYGTAVTVAKFFEYASETMALNRAFLLSQQLRAGRMFQSSSRRTATTRSAAGTVNMEVPTSGFGPLLNLLHGETVTPAKEGATTMYKQVHPIGTTDPFGKYVTLQLGKPTDEGVVNPFTYPGTILLAMTLDCQTGGFLETVLTLDAQDELTATALATASYPTALESFNFTQCTVKVNGVEQKQVRGVNITINTPKDIGRYYLGTEKKARPLTNAYNTAALTLTVDYSDNTLYKLFEEAKVVPVEVIYEGNPVEAIAKKLKLVFPAVGLDGDTPNVTGPPVLQQQIPLVTLDNNTETPLTATYIAADSAL
jgi:hypothetical protein